jgi:hypothetical protein
MIDRLDPLPPLGSFIADILALDAADDGAAIASMTIAMPIELDVTNGGGAVLALGASPPTQQIETTILPVFHHLQFTLVADDITEDEEGDDAGAFH